MQPLLDVRELEVKLFTRSGTVTAIDRLSFTVEEKETVALVGESGCGKSMTALAIMGLLPSPPARLTGGEVLLQGRDLARLGDSAMQKVRGRQISMIFQDPMSSLNPVMTIGAQLSEILRRHMGLTGASARKRAIELLAQVRIPDPQRRYDAYPHELSGGMNQRVVIAMAIACEPKLLIADEPTTALDVTIQSQILKLLRDLQLAYGMGIIFITHDLGVVAEMADRAVVMYAGRKIEEAPIDPLFEQPLHPYTRGLIGSTPAAEGRHSRLAEIPGSVPSLRDLPAGCAFSNRCPSVFAACHSERPPLIRPAPERAAACLLVQP